VSDGHLRALEKAVLAGGEPGDRLRFAFALERAGRRDEAISALLPAWADTMVCDDLERLLRSGDRKHQLSWRSSAAHERAARSDWLETLDADLRAELEKAECVYAPLAQTLLRSVSPITSTGLGGGRDSPGLMPKGYRFLEVSWPEQALAMCAAVSSRFDDSDAIMFPQRGNPAYRVRFGWGRAEFGRLWPHSPQNLWLFTVDRSAGIVIDNYSGYLQGDPNPNKVVFEVATWGT
jgi:hypothetical protein